MSELKWTAAGVEVEPTKGHKVEYVLSPTDGIIAQVWTPSDGSKTKRAAHAKLLAAAPDLLAAAEIALEELLRYDQSEHSIKPETNNTPEVVALRAAIAKAGGT